ncbi:unnamed protein product [Lactuca saligna]|uniref:Uncharacterized protein n=1 Tax=Lactuca saligna TaxID=75948 RepID=A0AA35YVQ5_LACSI|nr:unnamed protein product [Lactuca saligna]
MILKNKGRAICRYNENEVLPNVEGVVGKQKYRTDRREILNRDIHHALHADLMEHIYRTYIQPSIEFSRDDLFDESDEDSHMFFNNEDFDDENDVRETEEEDEVDDEDDDSE